MDRRRFTAGLSVMFLLANLALFIGRHHLDETLASTCLVYSIQFAPAVESGNGAELPGRFTAALPGQTMVNPDVSAIADMRYVLRDDVVAGLAGRNVGSFEFKEIELTLTGYLDPYMRADFFLGIHGVTGPFELEEGYASVVRGVSVQLRFGKYLLDFGGLNTQYSRPWDGLSGL